MELAAWRLPSPRARPRSLSSAGFSMRAPDFLATRTLVPSSVKRMPTRVGCLRLRADVRAKGCGNTRAAAYALCGWVHQLDIRIMGATFLLKDTAWLFTFRSLEARVLHSVDIRCGNC
jgi:hypothetical protein